jgi:hypothetical protein
MVFSGEASWRWRMMRPASDPTYETLWRQLARWLASPAPAAVTLAPVAVAIPGASATLPVIVRDEEFTPVADAEVSLTVTPPDGQSRPLTAALADPQDGRYVAAARFDQAGVYRVDATARRNGEVIGTASRVVLAGGADLEMSDPRLNEDVLRRLALATGGRYLPAGDVAEMPELLRAAQTRTTPPEVRDLWHNGWTLSAIVALLGAEWLLRRRVGLA